MVGPGGPQKPRRLDKFRIEYISDFNKGSFFGAVSGVPRGGGLTFSFHGSSQDTHHNHSVTFHATSIWVFLGLGWSVRHCSAAGWRQDMTATPTQTCRVSYLPQGRQSNRDYLTNPLNNNLGRATKSNLFFLMPRISGIILGGGAAGRPENISN